MERDYQVVLFTHLKSKEDRDNLKESYRGCKVITDATIRRVVQMKLDESIKKSDDAQGYDKPAWAEFQADGVGYRRALREILELLP